MQRMQVAKRTLWFLKSPHHMLLDGGPQLRASPGSWGAMRRDKGWTGSCSWTESCASLPRGPAVSQWKHIWTALQAPRSNRLSEPFWCRFQGTFFASLRLATA